MKIKKYLFRCAIVAALISAVGIGLKIYDWREPPFGKESKIAADIRNSIKVLCFAPAWCLLNKVGLGTPFDERWGNVIGELEESSYWKITNWQVWDDWIRFSLSWFVILSVATFAYQFIKLGSRKAWARIRPKRK